MLYTPGAVLVGMVYEFLPFMILPIFTSLEKIDNSLYEAAADLGANAIKTFLRVTLPLSMPGVVAGTILVFIPVMGTFIVSDILGGRQVILVGNLIQRQFLDARDPTFGSAASLGSALERRLWLHESLPTLAPGRHSQHPRVLLLVRTHCRIDPVFLQCLTRQHQV
jgi:ABC-type spermidine/putrescine transport system permease subunit I